MLAAVKHASRRLRRWPTAMLDRGCARCRRETQAGTEKQLSDRTEKHALKAVMTGPMHEPTMNHRIVLRLRNSRLTGNPSYEVRGRWLFRPTASGAHRLAGVPHQDLRERAGDRGVVGERLRRQCRRRAAVRARNGDSGPRRAPGSRCRARPPPGGHRSGCSGWRSRCAALSDGFGSEPWISRTWCSDISPARSSSATASRSSTSTAISWPRLSRLSGANVSWCASWSIRWVPGITRMAPLAKVLSDSATQAVTMSGGSSPQ